MAALSCWCLVFVKARLIQSVMVFHFLLFFGLSLGVFSVDEEAVEELLCVWLWNVVFGYDSGV